MDFIDRLCDAINTIPDLPIKIRKGYLSEKESLGIYPIPGGQVGTRYYDGTKEEQLNYEIQMQSKEPAEVETALWQISDFIERLDHLDSQTDSFQFNNITIASKPFLGQPQEQEWFVFLLQIQATITTY